MENEVGELEVRLANDNCRVVIRYRDTKLNPSCVRQIQLLPHKARYMANFLIDYVTEAETHCPEKREQSRRIKHT